MDYADEILMCAGCLMLGYFLRGCGSYRRLMARSVFWSRGFLFDARDEARQMEVNNIIATEPRSFPFGILGIGLLIAGISVAVLN